MDLDYDDDERYEDELEADLYLPDVTDCPIDGVQDVTGTGTTRGPDPYGVDHLACGHWVICFGPDEPNIIFNGARVLQ